MTKKLDASGDESERLTLAVSARYLLAECRMVLPGIQALFGFQLVSVFSASFATALSQAEKHLHLVALGMIAIAVVLVMTPAAIHRRMGARHVSRRFIETSTQLLFASMFPLALGICIDFYLIARVISGNKSVALLLALGMLAVISVLWFFFPRLRFESLRSGNPGGRRKSPE